MKIVLNPFVHRNMYTCLYLSQYHLSLSPICIFTYMHMQSRQGDQTDLRYEWRFQGWSLFISTSRYVTDFYVPHVVAVGLQHQHLHCHIRAHHGIHTMPNLIRTLGKKSLSTAFEPDKEEVTLPKTGYQKNKDTEKM